MRRTPLVALWLTALLPATLVAQPPVDFSGRWTLEPTAIASTPAVPGTPAAVAAPGDMGSGWGSTITIAQGPNELRVEYVLFSRYDLQPPLTFTYPLDGSVGRNTVNMGRGEQLESSRAAVEWSDAGHHHDGPDCRPWRRTAVHRRVDATAGVGIADDLDCGSDPRRRARRARFHDALDLSTGLRHDAHPALGRLTSSSRAPGRSARHVAPATNWPQRPPPGARPRPSRA